MRTLLIVCFLPDVGIPAWGADHLRDGPDSANTGWAKDEKIFTTANVKNTTPLWKMKLDTAARVK
jgi:hypothetical protein